MKPMHRTLFVFLVSLSVLPFSAAQAELKIEVTPNHEDWQYSVAEPIEFHVTVTEDNQSVSGLDLVWKIGPEEMEPFQKGVTRLEEGGLVLKSHGLDRPGFLRCSVSAKKDGKEIRGLATGAYEPYRIEPTTPMPEDFETFWRQELEKLKDVPLESKMERIDSECTDRVEVFHISYANGAPKWNGTSRMYGMLAVPKGDGPFPAVLEVPGAGVRPYKANPGWAEKGFIHLSIGIHGIPVNLPQGFYDALGTGALDGYPTYNLNDRGAYYYKRVFTGCVRAIDFLVSLPSCDRDRIGIRGGSQGGALSMITAGLDSRIKFVAPMFPAMCDHYGYFFNRAGGWPHLFQGMENPNRISENLKTAPYYDVVNFARVLKAPVLMGLGFNDEVCPPTSMFAAYNVLPGSKDLKIYQPYGHQWISAFDEFSGEWLRENLKKDR